MARQPPLAKGQASSVRIKMCCVLQCSTRLQQVAQITSGRVTSCAVLSCKARRVCDQSKLTTASDKHCGRRRFLAHAAFHRGFSWLLFDLQEDIDIEVSWTSHMTHLRLRKTVRFAEHQFVTLAVRDNCAIASIGLQLQERSAHARPYDVHRPVHQLHIDVFMIAAVPVILSEWGSAHNLPILHESTDKQALNL